jgi:hypothetical protein
MDFSGALNDGFSILGDWANRKINGNPNQAPATVAPVVVTQAAQSVPWLYIGLGGAALLVVLVFMRK